jgi:riboflavin synthase
LIKGQDVFTGIVEEVGTVTSVSARSLVVVASRVLKEMQLGSSIAVNGVCLTVTDFDGKSFSADVMTETLKRTNLGQLRAGDRVNLERPLALGGQVGGHLVQGHVDDTGRIASVISEGDSILIRFEAPAEVMRFIVPKGFIAVDGVSLTVASRDTDSFQVAVVDYTRQNTILGSQKVGDVVNLEADIIGKYVAEFSKPQATGITVEFLNEHGFSVS